MSAAHAQEATELLQRLLRINTVNPPGNERPAQELLAGHLRDAGLETTLLGEDANRPNLVARLPGRAGGPVLGLLSHVDTVLADPAGWRHGPWSGDFAEGCVWGRGALDMKSQTAAEAAAVCSLAREGWRPEHGDVVLISVADEEEGGTGAEWICAEHPAIVRCDYLLNEGGGEALPIDSQRIYAVSTAEKGVFRFTLTTEGVAGHASLLGADNALLKLAPLLEAMARRRPGWDVTPGPRAMLAGLGIDTDGDPGAALAALSEHSPGFALLAEAMMRVTLAPTMVDASRAMNVIPETARLHVDCRVPPGMDEPEVTARLREVLGAEGYRLEYTESLVGTASAVESPLMDALNEWVSKMDPGARCLPTVSVGYSDSRTFRAAFPDCVAYGFFPYRHMPLSQVTALPHARNERIDVRDLALAVECYRSVTRSLLGG
ncbi:MAG TPA: M20/M25/M40 family metallo-hydrolase [Thermoleophilaceae bacterium]|nr:M20/M25/M40 family metallo-hydrolase [Thermoleophilaceae bacterium]